MSKLHNDKKIVSTLYGKSDLDLNEITLHLEYDATWRVKFDSVDTLTKTYVILQAIKMTRYTYICIHK